MPNGDDDALSTVQGSQRVTDGMTPPARDCPRELMDRIRSLLPDRPLREVRMFGALALMVDGAMAVAVHKDGSLLVRVDPAEDSRLLANPHVSRAEMGAARSMGEGWIRVEATTLHNDPALADWLAAATRNLAQRKPAHSPVVDVAVGDDDGR